jgi:hypothetical protein
MFRGQMEASWAIADLITNLRSVRVDVIVEPGIYSLDAVDQIDPIVVLGRVSGILFLPHPFPSLCQLPQEPD